MPRTPRNKKRERERRALQAELANALDALRANERAFQWADDPLRVEQLIYQHAALLCRCRAALRLLRGGAA